MKDLSIIIVNWNTKDLVLRCLDSIAKSKPKLRYEVIVVDNGSTDGSVTALKKLQKSRHPKLQVRLIENQENLGFAKANNQGIKKAEGKYVLLLNSDAQIKKGAIKKLVKFVEKKKDAGGVGPKFLNPDGSKQGSVFRLPTIGRAVRQYWMGEKGFLEKYVPKGKKPKEVEGLSMGCFLLTQNALKSVGKLDERYFMYFEDLDYCRRIERAGLKLYYLPSAEVVHYHGASGKSLATDAEQWRRLIPSSKIYHGLLKHYIITFIIWTGQKWQKLRNW